MPQIRTEFRNLDIKSLFILKVLIIIVASVVIYLNTLNGEFVWDDRGSFLSNVSIREINNIPLFFTTDSWKITGNPSGSYYRPIINTWWTLEFHLWGEKPVGYHVTNIILHTLLSVLFYTLCLKILCSEPAAFFSALIFALHPIHTENVAWITGVGYLICTLFILLSLLFYIRFRENKSITFLILSILNFILATFSIEYALMLPFVIIAYEYLIKQKKVEIKFLLPFFFISLLYLIVRDFIVTLNINQELPVYSRILTSSVIFVKYLEVFFFPYTLNILYDIKPVTTLLNTEVISSILILTSVFLLTVYCYKYEKKILFALIWFFVILIPAANIIVILKPQMMSLRYLYIPSMGLSMVLGIYIEKLYTRYKITIILIIMIITLFSIKTYMQNKYWLNEINLYEKMVNDSPTSALARNNLGVAYLEAGMNLKAFSEFQKAVQLDPSYGFAVFNLGNTYQTFNMFDEAIFYLQKAIEINPSDSRAYNNLGVIYKKMGRYQESLYEFNRSLAANPQNYEAHYNVANLLTSIGQEKDAIPHYIEFLRLAPAKYNAMKLSIEKMLAEKGVLIH